MSMQMWLAVDLVLIPILILVIILIVILTAIVKRNEFKNGTYAQMTGNGFFETVYDLGKYGEYLTYKLLKSYEDEGGRFVFNCYLPKENGTTTEVDVMLINPSGIFVIESKNYSGWIFGSEENKTWTQTLPNGNRKTKKEHFYNPVMQNNTHIRCLKRIVGENVPIYSVIAFSERCTLKSIDVYSSNVAVINRQNIFTTVKYMGERSIQALSKMDIERIYGMLYPYTRVTEYEKLQHIDNVNALKHGGKAKAKPTGNIVNINDFSVNRAQSTATKRNIDSVQNIDKLQNADKLQNIDKVQSINNAQHTGNEAEVNAGIPQDKRICPRCGAELTLRTAKKGKHVGEQFYGCSRFPKCRYIVSDL